MYECCRYTFIVECVNVKMFYFVVGGRNIFVSPVPPTPGCEFCFFHVSECELLISFSANALRLARFIIVKEFLSKKGCTPLNKSCTLMVFETRKITVSQLNTTSHCWRVDRRIRLWLCQCRQLISRLLLIELAVFPFLSWTNSASLITAAAINRGFNCRDSIQRVIL